MTPELAQRIRQSLLGVRANLRTAYDLGRGNRPLLESLNEVARSERELRTALAELLGETP